MVWEIGPILIIQGVDFEKAFFYIKLNKAKIYYLTDLKKDSYGVC